MSRTVVLVAERYMTANYYRKDCFVGVTGRLDTLVAQSLVRNNEKKKLEPDEQKQEWVLVKIRKHKIGLCLTGRTASIKKKKNKTRRFGTV